MTIHLANILKKVTTEEFQNLAGWQKNIIANDLDHSSASFNWFTNFVKNRAQAIYEDPLRWENDYEARWPRQLG